MIDEAERLLEARFLIDPEAEPERIAELDRKRSDLLREKIPRFDQVIRKIGSK